VNILAFTIFPDLPGRHNWFMLRNAARPDYVLTEDLVLHYIELYKPEPASGGPEGADRTVDQRLGRTAAPVSEQPTTPALVPTVAPVSEQAAEPAAKPSRLAAWIELLRAEREGEDMKVLLNDDLIFQRAHEAFQWCTHDRESRELALSRERFLRDQASNLEYALEQGIEQGINTGREENKKENARAMKLRGFDTTLIMEITGLDQESVDTLY